MATLQEIIDNAGLDDASKAKLKQKFEHIINPIIQGKRLSDFLFGYPDTFQSEVSKSNLESYLHTAVARSYFSVAHFLINHGVDINAVAEIDRSNVFAPPLHVAAGRGHKEIVLLLLEKGANINAVSNRGTSALHYAGYKRWNNIFILLLNKGANTEVGTDTPDGTPLHFAASVNNHTFVKLLLEKGANVKAKNSYGDTPLHNCSKTMNPNGVECVKLLLEYGANIEATNKNGETALLRALARDNEEIAIKLLENGANMDVKNYIGAAPIHLAAAYTQTNVLKWLLDKKVAIETENNEGLTALHLAAARGHLACVVMLVEAGANIEMHDCENQTPLFHAAQKGNSENDNGEYDEGGQEQVLKYLLKKGANIEVRDSDLNQTALIRSAFLKYSDNVKVLLNFGANIDVADYEGNTPLHMAIKGGIIQDLVKLFLLAPKPANIYAMNTHSDMPLYSINNIRHSPEEIKDAFNLHAALLKCIPLIPTPWSVDKSDNNKSPAFYNLNPYMILKIAVMRLQNMFEIKDTIKAEKLIVDITHKRNMGVLKVLMKIMAVQIVDGKKEKGKESTSDVYQQPSDYSKSYYFFSLTQGDGSVKEMSGYDLDEGIEEDAKIVYQQLSHYSQNFYFFSLKQRERFVKVMSGKDLSDESIEEVIEEVEKDNNVKMVNYLNCFTNWQTITTPQA